MRPLFVIFLLLSLLPHDGLAQDVSENAPRLSGYSPNDSGAYSAVYEKYDRGITTATDRFTPVYSAEGDYRQPVSLVVLDPWRVLVPTKQTGELYEFAVGDRSIRRVAKFEGREFGKSVRVDASSVVLADTRHHEIVLVQNQPGEKTWTLAQTLAVPGQPHAIHFDETRSQLWVSSLWGQRLHLVNLQLQPEPCLTLAQTIDLPMCGGQVLSLDSQGVVLVTDAFGSEYVIIDRESAKVIRHGQLYEHNIREIASLNDGETILFPQQLLAGVVPAVQSQITWGNFISNNLRLVRTQQLLEATGAEVYTGSQFIPVGAIGNGAGDPTSMAMIGDDRVAVTIGGTNQVAIGSLEERKFDFVDVGLHPVDCEFVEGGRTLLVLNQFSDSLTVVDVESPKIDHVAMGKLRPPTDVERGEQLFHDSTLSHDGWMSCQSCHTGGHTNGLLADNLTDDSYQSPKRVLSLLGQAETAPYSWTGSMKSIEDQVAFSIKSTMASDHPVRPEDVTFLAAYVRSLTEPPSLHKARGEQREDSELLAEIERGRTFFASAGCVDCHAGPRYTSTELFDVGIHDEQGNKAFNPPSLIGVSQRQNSLFHDGRATSLEDVILKFKHQVPADATENQTRDLIEFLKSL